MTADVELLPLPEIERWRVTGDYAYPTEVDPEGGAVDYDAHIAAMQTYARANVEHHTEALRAEVAEARDGWHMANGTADLAMKHRDAAEARAERLAEALRLYEKAGIGNSTDFRLQAEARDAANRALLRDQEEGK